MSSDNKRGPIRVCFVAPKAYPLFNPNVKEVFGGAEVDLYLLAMELAKDENFAVSFITADYRQKPVETIQRVTVIKSVDFRKNPLSGAIKVWHALKAADAQIYFQETSSWGTFLVLLFCKLNKKNFIYRTASQRECDGTYLKQHFFGGKAFRWSLRNATQIVVQNKTDQRAVERTMGVLSIVIPNAHHLPMLSEVQKDIILWVGRSIGIKRPGLFIELAKRTPGEKFTMICQRATGDEKYEELVAQAKAVENLEFIKRIQFDKICNYFQRAKVFVNTSDSEGFPNTFIQACKCETPILSLKVNPDGFLDKYRCGACCKDDLGCFTDSLRSMLTDKHYVELGRNARKYAEEHHNITKIIEQYKAVFEQLVNRDRNLSPD